MQLPNRIVEIVATLNSRNATLSKGTDDQRRQLTRMIQEQIVSELGGQWGGKVRSGLGDENMGKDSIGYLESDQTVSVWDWQNGSTRESTLRAGSDPDYPHLPQDEARFISRQGVNHLGVGSAPTPVDPAQPQPSGDLNAMALSFIPAAANSLDVLHAEARQAQATLDEILSLLKAMPPPTDAIGTPDQAQLSMLAGAIVSQMDAQHQEVLAAIAAQQNGTIESIAGAVIGRFTLKKGPAK